MRTGLSRNACVAALAVLCLTLVASPAFAYRQWINMLWTGLPTGEKPNNSDVYFKHNTDDEKRTMDDAGEIVAGDADIKYWGGSLHVPSEVDPGSRHFFNPVLELAEPGTTSGENRFIGKFFFYDSTEDDRSTGNVELGDDSADTYYITVHYTERFHIVQHYSGLPSSVTEPADQWVTDGANRTITTDFSKTVEGYTYVCMGWTGGSGVAPDGTTNTVTITSASSDVTVTWVYRRAHMLNITVSPSAQQGGAQALPHYGNRLVAEPESPTEKTVASVVQEIGSGNDRYLCSGYTAGSGSVSPTSGVGTVSAGRVERDFLLRTNSAITFTYEFQNKVTVSVTPSTLATFANPYPPVGVSWFAHDAPVTANVVADVVDSSTGYRWGCIGWTGSGNIAASGTNATTTYTNTQMSTVNWRYQRIVSYDVAANGLPVYLPLTGQPTFSHPRTDNAVYMSSTQTISAPLVVYETVSDASVRYVCVGWSGGTGDIPASGSTNTMTVVVAGASTITWQYRKEYRLKVDVSPGEYTAWSGAIPTGTSWHAEGMVVTSSVLQVVTNPVTSNTFVCLGGYASGAAVTSVETVSGGRMRRSFVMTEAAQILWMYDALCVWTIGQPITPPAGADSNIAPTITIVIPYQAGDTAMNAFLFGGAAGQKKLYPLRPITSALVSWQRAGGGIPLLAGGICDWPADTNMQRHVAMVPTVVLPAGSTFAGYTVQYAENDAQLSDSVFNATTPGRSVLQFVDGIPPDPVNKQSRFIVVKTVAWNDPSFLVETNWPVGSAITNVWHSDTNKNGYVFFEKSFYDASACRRDTRKGPILPVNRDTLKDDDDMVVVWSERGIDSQLQIYWPTRPYRYHCAWPDEMGEPVDVIYIASQNGSGPLSVVTYPQAQIYVQSDPLLPGYNPNEEHAGLFDQGGANAVFALRNDLNAFLGASLPYVLCKYKHPISREWAMKVYKVEAEGAGNTFNYQVVAGKPILPPTPISLIMPYCTTSHVASGEVWYHRDHKGGHWAKAAGTGAETASIVMHWYYPLQTGYYYPDYDNDGNPDAAIGDAVPFLNGGTDHVSQPTNVAYTVNWPTNSSDYAVMALGETIMKAKVPVFSMAAAEVIFDEGIKNNGGPLVKLLDPLSERWVTLEELPSSILLESDGTRKRFKDLPEYLKLRLSYDPQNKRLYFGGVLNESGVGDPLLLLNVMSRNERQRLQDFNTDWAATIGELYAKTRNPNGIEYGSATVTNPYVTTLEYSADEWIGLWGENQFGLRQDTDGIVRPDHIIGLPKAITAGAACGTGWVVVAENDDPVLGAAPVALHLIRVDGEPYVGQIKVINPGNVFDEKLTLRHSGDFGGDPDNMVFEWYYKPDTSGFAPSVPGDDPGTPSSDWTLFGSGQGLQEITIEGASPLTLADNWFVVRYSYASAYPFYTNTANNSQKSLWAGQPGLERRAQLAPGWVKRVVAGLNPFDARVTDFHASPVNTMVSMLAQLGSRYEGPIAFNGDPDNLNNIGMIEAYETVLLRAIDFSIGAGINYGPANSAIMNISTRLSDFYMLLGNEAYQDAIDPTIGFGTSSGEYGTLAPSIFAFQNQVSSLLDEELVLLRGRDDSSASVSSAPVYNRFFWNFSQGEGEVAYAQAYNVSDQKTADTDNDGYVDSTDGVINEDDAKVMYPQGHGDAWGHYLSAMKYYYSLLRHPNFSWEPRPEAVLIGGAAVTVDYLDERKFARAAAAKAKVGSEIVNLTYRSCYVDAPSGQWQGYKDTDSARAWGLDDWGRRAAQGAYFDWAVANAILPSTDPDTNHTGIAKIDRSTVVEVSEIASHFAEIESQVDNADAGLNPLGLAKGVVPFDIDPSLLTTIYSPRTHFEQVYDRAIEAMKNAVAVFDYANQLTQMLRRNEDSRDEFSKNIDAQERDYINRLIEIFGYPYADDIGPNGTYPSGYEGPDWAHFMYVDRSELTGIPIETMDWLDVSFNFGSTNGFDQALGIVSEAMDVSYTFSSDDRWIVKPVEWTTQRRAPGEAQMALSDLILAKANLNKAMTEYEGSIADIAVDKRAIEAQYNLASNQIEVVRSANNEKTTLDEEIRQHNINQVSIARSAEVSDRIFEAVIESIPKCAGIAAADVCAPARGILFASKATAATAFNVAADTQGLAMNKDAQAKDLVDRNKEITLMVNQAKFDLLLRLKELQNTVWDSSMKRMELAILQQQVDQAQGRYLAVVAKGERLLEERATWRKSVAPDIQDYRYQDMTFRIFRNDALQKYRAQFDLAARYAYLAATAYDYETNLLGDENGSGREFLTDLVRQRSLGQMINGSPMVGQSGLADPLARLSQNFAVYKTQMGFNNPQTETSRFSLRQELFRIKPDAESDEAWRNVLAGYRVANLWNIPEYRRYCRPFAAESAEAQPGLVIPFSTCIQYGKNFFGWPLGGGDSTYDPTHFATKIRSVGVWFSNYDGRGLSYTPRVYLVPTGADVMRSPSGDTLKTREWKVVDQKIPVPFPIGTSDMQNPDWIPLNDSLSEEFSGIRRFSRFRAYHDSGSFNTDETVSDSRLIGRSVWNTKWLLIIPGETLLNPPAEGLDTFIYGLAAPGGGRDLNGVKDIRLFFQTYAYSGN